MSEFKPCYSCEERNAADPTAEVREGKYLLFAMEDGNGGFAPPPLFCAECAEEFVAECDEDDY